MVKTSNLDHKCTFLLQLHHTTKFYTVVKSPLKQGRMLCDRHVLYETVSQHPLQLLWLRLNKSCSSHVASHCSIETWRSSSGKSHSSPKTTTRHLEMLQRLWYATRSCCMCQTTAAPLCIRLLTLDIKEGHYVQTRNTTKTTILAMWISELYLFCVAPISIMGLNLGKICVLHLAVVCLFI